MHGFASGAQASRSGAQARMILSQGRNLARFFQIRGASSHAFKPGTRACMVSDRGRKLPDRERELACFQARASLHGFGSGAQASRSGAQARMLLSQGRKLAWFRIGGASFQIRGASSHALKPGAQAWMVSDRGHNLPDQGRKLAWLGAEASRPGAQARMLLRQGHKLAWCRIGGASFQIRGVSSHDFKPGAQACMVSDRGHKPQDQGRKPACV